MKISNDINRSYPCWQCDRLAQHRYRARGQTRTRGWLPKGGEMSDRKARKCTQNARVHLFARRVYFTGGSARRLDAAIEANLRELGYGEETP